MGRPEEAEEAANTHPDHDPPPPYEPREEEGSAPPLPPRRDIKNNPFLSDTQTGPAAGASSSSTSSSALKTPNLVALPRKFPAAFGMYYQKAIRTPTFNLGVQEDQPAFSVTFHSDRVLAGLTHLILHSSADPESAPLAIAEKQGRLGHRAIITLPEIPPESGATSAASATTTATTTEELSAHISFTSTSYGFSIETGGQREKFEWRSSKGSEVRSLLDDEDDGSGGSSHRHVVGRKLVRLSYEAEGVGGTRAVRDQGSSSDGREVVAVWADNPKWSGNRAGVFRFLGSAAAGYLGDRFAVMAVVSAVQIWELLNETSLKSAATSASVQ